MFVNLPDGTQAISMPTDKGSWSGKLSGWATTTGDKPSEVTFTASADSSSSDFTGFSCPVVFNSTQSGYVSDLPYSGVGNLPTSTAVAGVKDKSIIGDRVFNFSVDVAGTIPALRAGDLKINDIDIGASYASDDTVSPPNNAAGSAIAKAAAINRKAAGGGIERGETQNIVFSGTPSGPFPRSISVAGITVNLDALDLTAASVAAKVSAALKDSSQFGEASGRVVNYIPGNPNLTITYKPSEGNVQNTEVVTGASGMTALVDTTVPALTTVGGTGVFAKVNENVLTGQAMSGTSSLTGVIFINGMASAKVTTVLNNTRETRANVVKAINLISDTTKVKAIDTGSDTKGITLVAADGRNIEVSFETNSDTSEFGKRIGMRQGVQASTISLESKIPSPVRLSSESTGDITRAGLVNGDFTRNQAIANSSVRPPVGPAVAQVNSVSITGTPSTQGGDVYSVVVNGITFDSAPTLAGDSAQSVRDKLVEKINANFELPVVAKAGRNTGEILLTAKVPGIGFTTFVAKSSGSAAAIQQVPLVENKPADYKALGQNDLVINGVKIPASNAASDDTPNSLVSSNAKNASAIAIAAAINSQTALTAVRAEAVGATIKGGGPMNTNTSPLITGPTKEYLYVNGSKIEIEFKPGEDPNDRRDNVVKAINQRFGEHGVMAQNTGSGVSLTSDGRNLSVWFDSNVEGLSASSFGLDQGGAQKQVTRISLSGNVTPSSEARVTINGLDIRSEPLSGNISPAGLASALQQAIGKNSQLKNIQVAVVGDALEISSTVPGSPFEVWGASVFKDVNLDGTGGTPDANVSMSINELAPNSQGNNLVTAIRGADEFSTSAQTVYGTVRTIAQPPQLPGLPMPIGAPPSEYDKLLRANGKPFSITAGDDGFGPNSNFSALGFHEGTYGGRSSSDMDPPKVGRLAFQVGASANQLITIDLADFGKNGPITGEITGDVDQNIESRNIRINTREGATAVLAKLDVAMDQVNATRATMGAVMNRLDHVINNLTNVSMNMSASRSQIEDADYAAASTELAKNQIMQQAGTAVLAQANTSQQSVLKLLGG